MVSPAEIKLVKNSLPCFQEYGYEVAVMLYQEVFKVDRNLSNLFSQDFLVPRTSQPVAPSGCPFQRTSLFDVTLSTQARILAQTIILMASKIDNLGSMDSAIERICNRHVSRDIRAEHYDIVAAAFDTAMRTVLKSELSADEFTAWGSAIGELTRVFTARETAIREASAAKTGGWIGFRKFIVQERFEMGHAGTKLLLAPVDKGPICPGGEGKFSCLRVHDDNFGTIYHNTVLYSPRNLVATSENALTPGCKDPGGPASRLPSPEVTLERMKNASRAGTPSNSDLCFDFTRNSTYAVIAGVAAAKEPPMNTTRKSLERIVTRGHVIAQHAAAGAVVELSVPLEGCYNSEARGRKLGGNSSPRISAAHMKLKGHDKSEKGKLFNSSSRASPLATRPATKGPPLEVIVSDADEMSRKNHEPSTSTGDVRRIS